jgi:hypothetical protein
VPVVRPATALDRERVVDTVVAAFVADPVFRYLFEGDGEAGGGHDQAYARHAAVFAGALFDLRVGHGTVWLVQDGAALAMWAPPGPGGHAGELGHLDLPPGPAGRLQEYEAALHAVMPTREHWYLGVLATHPARAGQRWGRLAMGPGLAAAAADGLPAYLETASEANVALYRRSGWEVSATATVGPLAVRVMARPGP